MAAVDNLTEYKEPTYGNWRVPRAAGIGRLSGFATALIFIFLLIVVFLMQFANLLVALVAAVIFALIVGALSYTDRDGISIGGKAAERLIFMFSKLTKRNTYRSGVFSIENKGKNKLPGVASSSVCYTMLDSENREFAMLHFPAVSTYSVVFAVEPDGAALVDQPEVDQWVANWGGFLGLLGRETGLVGAAATIETAPGSGVQVRKEIESSISPEASSIAQTVLQEAALTYPSGSSQIRCWVTLTFNAAPRPGMKRRKPEDMGRELSTKIPAFASRLETTGAGVATPMNEQELAEIIRTAYDPASSRLFEDAFYNGEHVELDWEQIGPTAHTVDWNTYHHDSGVSVCWTMTEAPRGHTYSNVLARLVAPHRDIARKRVTVLYRPIDSARTVSVAEKDQNQARVRATNSGEKSARATIDLEAAKATAREEARGAGLLYFGMVVSATVENSEELPEAIATIEQELSPSSRISLRRAYGAHDGAFAATLPLGVIPGNHTIVPRSVNEVL